MKVLRVAFLLVSAVLIHAVAAYAQEHSTLAVQKPHWSVGVFGVGGTGIKEDSDIHNFGIGGRVGRVLTGEHGASFLRGTFEWNAEVLPFHQFYSPGETATGAVINPLVAKWNFTTGKKTTPFVEVIGGTILTNKDFPPGDTSSINFNSGVGFGMNIFTRSNRSVAFDARALHISNASIGNHNPGVNVSLQFTIGYTWWK